MAGPLIIKKQQEFNWLELVAFVVFVMTPIGGFIWCWVEFGGIHFEQPWLNLTAHTLLILLPLVWARMVSSTPMEFAETEEIVLGRASFLRQFPVDWWMSLLTLAAPLFAAAMLGYEFFTHHLAHPAELATSPFKAMAVMGVTFVLGLFCATVFTGSSEPRSLVSEAGLRNGISVFYPWTDIARIGTRGNLYIVYHQVNPALPATCFAVRDAKARAVLEQFLAAKQVTISNTTHPQYTFVRLGVLGGFVALLLGCWWLRLNTSISLLWITLGAFGTGCILTLLVERIRGVPSYKKYHPVIEDLPWNNPISPS
jgi:hypothetical protein